ncbi:MAG: hypothetical protein V8R63_00790 [Thomasclavelia ramosa]
MKQLTDGVDLIGYTPWGCIDLVSASTGEMQSVMVLFMLIDMMMEQVIFQEEKIFNWYKKLLKLMVKIWDNRCA